LSKRRENRRLGRAYDQLVAELRRLARVLLRHSLALRAEEELLVQAPVAALPLVEELYREALELGAYPTALLVSHDLTQIELREAGVEQLRHASSPGREAVAAADAVVAVIADDNTCATSRLDGSRVGAMRGRRAELLGAAIGRISRGELRWCTTLFPTNAHAQAARMSLDDYERCVYDAALLGEGDPVEAWRTVHRAQEQIVELLSSCRQLRLTADGTDLTYSVAGRTWINGSGTFNLPDGEVFTSPVEDSVNGTLRLDYPATYDGVEADGVELTFEDGRVVGARAAQGEEFLEAMLELDDGARYLGEVAFGLNPRLEEFTGNALLDEKIRGTAHVALGASYPLTGGVNRSALHWDLVFDLREGVVYADGEVCYRGGAFLV
jgi:aminopeptidase